MPSNEPIHHRRDPQKTRQWREGYLRTRKQICVTAELPQYHNLLQDAERAGFSSPGPFLLALHKAFREGRYLVSPETEKRLQVHLDHFAAELHGVCSNINQQTRYAHRHRKDDFAELQAKVNQLETVCRTNFDRLFTLLTQTKSPS